MKYGALNIFFEIILVCVIFLSGSAVYTQPSMAKYFNKTAAAEESKPELILARLNITRNMDIADIGSGGGYFTFRFASLTEGRVYAVDVNKEFLKYIKEQAFINKISNVIPVETKSNEHGLKNKSVDLIFIRNVFHHLPDQVEYLKSLKPVLKEKGRLVIIENKMETHIGSMGHGTDEKDILDAAVKAGYRLKESIKELPEQNFQIFLP